MKTPVKEEAAEAAGERIAKRIARAGLASRRDAEAMIEQGRVSVDGKTIKSPALNVTDEFFRARDVSDAAHTTLAERAAALEHLVDAALALDAGATD